MKRILASPAHRTLFGIWLGWALVMLGYQALVPSRLTLARPDYALDWTVKETQPHSQDGKIYLNEPFLNSHVSWDSEYYLAIAVGGYNDPAIHRVGGGASAGAGQGISLSYAFFPFYPLMIRLLAWPLSVLKMNPIATAALSGVVVSLLGTLAAMVALYELARDELGEDGGLRTAFYLIIFPSGFFLAQVYTEGLFIGLAFASLVLIRRGHRGWAAVLAVLATYTRAVGVALVIPLVMSWLKEQEWRDLDMEWRQIYYKGLPWRILWNALVAFAPLLAFLAWRLSYYGMAFGTVEQAFFGRGLFTLGVSFITWADSLRILFGQNPQASAYYLIEWFGILLGFTACLAGIRRHPDLAWFGLAVVVLSFTSGPAQGMYRYVLAAPPVFLFLSRLGKNRAFDLSWTLASVLVMGMLATLFTFDLWTG